MQPEYSNAAAKAINGMDGVIKKRIKKGIEGLMETPPQGDIKLLQGYKDKTYRLRIGDYRVIFRYETDDDGKRFPFISDIDSRGEIYK
jgi:mRNA interferase RelE/StbE